MTSFDRAVMFPWYNCIYVYQQQHINAPFSLRKIDIYWTWYHFIRWNYVWIYDHMNAWKHKVVKISWTNYNTSWYIEYYPILWDSVWSFKSPKKAKVSYSLNDSTSLLYSIKYDNNSWNKITFFNVVWNITVWSVYKDLNDVRFTVTDVQTYNWVKVVSANITTGTIDLAYTYNTKSLTKHSWTWDSTIYYKYFSEYEIFKHITWSWIWHNTFMLTWRDCYSYQDRIDFIWDGTDTPVLYDLIKEYDTTKSDI